MTTKEFLSIYWNQYILLEKEFLKTLQFVSLNEDNKRTYSNAYQKLILELGSEIDIALKQYCLFLESSFKGEKIHDYKKIVTLKKVEFVEQEIKVIVTDEVLQPWRLWNEGKNSPYWWTAYNKIKHDRASFGEIDGIKQLYYKFANQEYTLLALAGLFQILVYLYYDLACYERERITTPMPGSRLFELQGGIWDSVQFYRDYAFYINDDGHLIYETGTIQY